MNSSNGRRMLAIYKKFLAGEELELGPENWEESGGYGSTLLLQECYIICKIWLVSSGESESVSVI